MRIKLVLDYKMGIKGKKALFSSIGVQKLVIKWIFQTFMVLFQ